jgi:hypothetical protein
MGAMNQTERDIFYKLLIDLFLDQPGKTPPAVQHRKEGTDANTKTDARGRSKPVRQTNAAGR